MIPPLLLDFKVAMGNGKVFRLWFPLVILWPILIVLLLLLLPVISILQLGLSAKGIKLFSILINLLLIISALRGLAIEIKEDKDNNRKKIKIKID
jgi:O-antigen ligase